MECTQSDLDAYVESTSLPNVCSFVRRNDAGEEIERLDVPTEVTKQSWGAMTLDDILELVELAQRCQEKP